MNTARRYRYICHHEAGHALATWYFGYHTEVVSVVAAAEMRSGPGPLNRRGEHVAGLVGVASSYLLEDDAQLRLMLNQSVPLPPPIVDRGRVFAQICLISCYAGFIAEAAFRRASPAAVALEGGYADMQQADDILAFWFPETAERMAASERADRQATALVRSPPGAAAIWAMAAELGRSGALDRAGIERLCAAAYGGRQPVYDGWITHWPPRLADLRAGVIREAQAAGVSAA